MPPPGQGTPVGYGPSGGDAAGYGAPAGQYPPPAQQPGGYPQGGGGGHQPRPGGSGGVPQFQFDLKRLNRVDQIVGVASLIVLISLFLPWFSATYKSGFGTLSGSGSGTDAHGWLWLVFVIDLLIIAYLVMRAGWEEAPVRIPVAHAPLLIVATGLQLLLVLIGFFAMPGTGGLPGYSIGWDWGAFVGLLAALVAAGPVTWPAVQSYLQGRQR
jgi:hypothetical protein